MFFSWFISDIVIAVVNNVSVAIPNTPV